MGLDDLRDRIPEYAKDLRHNLGSVISNAALDPAAAWGSAVTAALVCKNAEVIQAVLADAEPHLDETQRTACRSAAAIMSMTNVWFKFRDAVDDDQVKAQPPKLRMNVLMGHAGVDRVLFETWCLAASVVTACGTCINAHTAEMMKHEMTAQQVVDVARIATVVKAVSDTLTFDAMA